MSGMRAWLAEMELPLLLIVCLRIVAGAELLYQGHSKLRDGYVRKSPLQVEGQQHPMAGLLNYWMEEIPVKTTKEGMTVYIKMFPWYKVFLTQAVVPHIKVFALIVTVAEIALGAMLILGLLVRVLSIFGVLLLLNYTFATWHLGFPYTVLNILFLSTWIVFGVVGAGRSLGVDAFLHERFPEIPFF